MIKSQDYDYVGMILSLLCGLHCLITPILIVSIPALGKSLQSLWLHSFLILLMAFVFYQSVYKRYKIHNSKHILGLGLTGFALVLISYLNEIFHGHEHHDAGHVEAHTDETLMIVLAITGAVFLISSHILNIQAYKKSLDNK